jgi:hypothetical protein
VITDASYATMPDGPWSGGVVAGGSLLLEQAEVGSVTGVAAHPLALRDVILDGRFSVVAGGNEDVIGWYLRQSSGERYLACGYGIAGRVGIFEVDGASRRIIVQGDLLPGQPFNPGLGVGNRVTVVACGPSLTFLLNGAVVAGVTVDRRFVEGHAGPVLIKASPGAPSRIAVGWLQIRAVLPDQPAHT